MHADYEGRVHLDFPTGNLNISGLVVNDERKYLCQYSWAYGAITAKLTSIIDLKVYGEASGY
jgi:hypothetical protein